MRGNAACLYILNHLPSQQRWRSRMLHPCRSAYSTFFHKVCCKEGSECAKAVSSKHFCKNLIPCRGNEIAFNECTCVYVCACMRVRVCCMTFFCTRSFGSQEGFENFKRTQSALLMTCQIRTTCLGMTSHDFKDHSSRAIPTVGYVNFPYYSSITL